MCYATITVTPCNTPNVLQRKQPQAEEPHAEAAAEGASVHLGFAVQADGHVTINYSLNAEPATAQAVDLAAAAERALAASPRRPAAAEVQAAKEELAHVEEQNDRSAPQIEPDTVIKEDTVRPRLLSDIREVKTGALRQLFETKATPPPEGDRSAPRIEKETHIKASERPQLHAQIRAATTAARVAARFEAISREAKKAAEPLKATWQHRPNAAPTGKYAKLKVPKNPPPPPRRLSELLRTEKM